MMCLTFLKRSVVKNSNKNKYNCENINIIVVYQVEAFRFLTDSLNTIITFL